MNSHHTVSFSLSLYCIVSVSDITTRTIKIDHLFARHDSWKIYKWLTKHFQFWHAILILVLWPHVVLWLWTPGDRTPYLRLISTHRFTFLFFSLKKFHICSMQPFSMTYEYNIGYLYIIIWIRSSSELSCFEVQDLFGAYCILHKQLFSLKKLLQSWLG